MSNTNNFLKDNIHMLSLLQLTMSGEHRDNDSCENKYFNFNTMLNLNQNCKNIVVKYDNKKKEILDVSMVTIQNNTYKILDKNIKYELEQANEKINIFNLTTYDYTKNYAHAEFIIKIFDKYFYIDPNGKSRSEIVFEYFNNLLNKKLIDVFDIYKEQYDSRLQPKIESIINSCKMKELISNNDIMKRIYVKHYLINVFEDVINVIQKSDFYKFNDDNTENEKLFLKILRNNIWSSEKFDFTDIFKEIIEDIDFNNKTQYIERIHKYSKKIKIDIELFCNDNYEFQNTKHSNGLCVSISKFIVNKILESIIDDDFLYCYKSILFSVIKSRLEFLCDDEGIDDIEFEYINYIMDDNKKYKEIKVDEIDNFIKENEKFKEILQEIYNKLKKIKDLDIDFYDIIFCILNININKNIYKDIPDIKSHVFKIINTINIVNKNYNDTNKKINDFLEYNLFSHLTMFQNYFHLYMNKIYEIVNRKNL